MPGRTRPLIAGNWKMNGLRSSAVELAAIAQGSDKLTQADLMICPPATLLSSAVAIAKGSRLALGGQDCHPAASGAHTGDVSAEMLADVGATAVIVGHSERRSDHGETDAMVRDKARAAWRAGLLAIVCVGETQAERDGGKTLEVIGRQIAGSLPERATPTNLVVAYEPVWAIGTGRTPTAKDVEEVHGFIRQKLNEKFSSDGAAVRILYGGSVKPSNAAELLAVADVGGALVGGASLTAADFLAIASACP
ncbi:triose-phosphate isomerase [Bradyrhizobium sp. WD16]|uniref:triose-phosphate isomerase n=1 Tax=Bradyrhizobium sp. WD16 TaxID=1521768 RepID=UPI0020A2340E|nr:triose-phosphate isomerase [Bradyrhizobium sp. WD16]UTD28975.1 triose-phosphate isomerase [Bradyrhizobium sp. WD16]